MQILSEQAGPAATHVVAGEGQTETAKDGGVKDTETKTKKPEEQTAQTQPAAASEKNQKQTFLTNGTGNQRNASPLPCLLPTHVNFLSKQQDKLITNHVATASNISRDKEVYRDNHKDRETTEAYADQNDSSQSSEEATTEPVPPTQPPTDQNLPRSLSMTGPRKEESSWMKRSWTRR